MRRITIVLGICLLGSVFSSPLVADPLEIQYTITGTFDASVSSGPLSGPNGAYTISFALPQNPVPDYYDPSAGDFAVYGVPLSYSFQCDGCTAAVFFNGADDDVDFATSSAGGMLVVEFLSDGHDYYWEFWGDQLFSGDVSSPALIAGGPFNLLNSGRFELDDNPFTPVGDATLMAHNVPTPEPSTFALTLAALASLALLMRSRARRA